MARTPRKTEKSVDYHSSMASPNHNTAGKERGENSGMTRSTSQEINKEPRKKDGGSGEGVPKPKQTLRLILGPKPTPEAEAAAAAAFLEAERPRRSSSRLSSHDCAPATPTLSVAQTREVTRKAKAKGKDTLIRKVFHNPDGSLRGAKSDVPSGTPSVVQARRPVQGQGQVPAQPQVRHSAQGQAQVPAKNGAAVEEAQNTSKVDKPSRVKPGEGGQSKNDDWRRKARGGVTLENAVEVKENAPVLINCGAYPGAIANSDILPRDGGRGEPPKQKLPPVFNFEHKPFRSSSGSTASSNFSNAHPGSSIQHRDMRENAIEIFEDGPVPHGYGAGHPKSMVDPQLLAFDDVRSGRVPPIEDQIWFMQSPFRVRKVHLQVRSSHTLTSILADNTFVRIRRKHSLRLFQPNRHVFR